MTQIVETIQFKALRRGQEECRLRDVSPAAVEALATDLVLEKGDTLRTPLTVLKNGDLYTIIDGNHRYEAMIKARRILGDGFYSKVVCHVYKDINSEEQLVLAMKQNLTSETIVAMTDYQKIIFIRKMQGKMTNIYSALKIKNVSCKR